MSILRFVLQDLTTERKASLLSAITVRGLAVVLFRLSQVLGKRSSLAGLFVKQVNHILTGADLAFDCEVGKGLQLMHPTGVVIGRNVRMGDECVLQQGVTLGGRHTGIEGHPHIGDKVFIGAGAKILGSITVGTGARIGANAVVLNDLPAGVAAVGVPAKIL